MAAPLFMSLIVFVGPTSEPGRPATCFTFSQPREPNPMDVRDESDQEDDVEILRPRRLQ